MTSIDRDHSSRLPGRPGPPRGDRPRLLFVSHFLPDPRGNGPEQRAAWTVRALAQRAHVHLVLIPPVPTPTRLPPEVLAWLGDGTAHQAGPSKGALGWGARALARFLPEVARRISRRLTTWPAFDGGQRRRALALLPEPPLDRIHVFRTPCAALLPELRERYPGAAIQLDYDDLESRTYRQLARLLRDHGRSRQARRLERTAARLARFEEAVLPGIDRVFLASDRDRRALATRIGGDHLAVLPNLPPAHATRLPPASRSPSEVRVLFVGTLGYPPNRDAIRTLLEEVSPRAEAAGSPPIRWTIAGKDDGRTGRRLAGTYPGLDLRPDCPDLTAAYAPSHAVVFPLAVVGGTSIKVLEAAAYGRPIVASPEVAESLGMRDGVQLLVASGPSEVAACLGKLYASPGLGERLVEAAGAWAAQHHGWSRFERALLG